mgnify:CR=1 FL=1|jgi:hypothetical protein
MDRPEPISQKKIDKINKVIKDMVFTYKGLVSDWAKAEFKYQFQIIGQKPMISVGDWYNFLIVSVLVVDGSNNTTLFLKYMTTLLTEYRTLRNLNYSISDELQYFFDGDYVRINIEKDNVRLSDEFQMKIKNTKLDI